MGGYINLTAKSMPSKCLISVSDNGKGIPVEHQYAIFKRFYRGNSKELPGAGLGLAIAKKMAGVLGGNIRVDSIPEEITTFTVEIEIVLLGNRAEYCDLLGYATAMPEHGFHIDIYRFFAIFVNALYICRALLIFLLFFRTFFSFVSLYR